MTALRYAIREAFIRWATRRQAVARHEIALHRRRIYILPTPYGYYFAVILLLMLLTAMNYSNSMGFALAFLLAGLGGSGLWHTHRNLLQLRLRYRGADAAFAGQPARFHLELDNPIGPARYGLYLQWQGRPGEPITVPARERAPLHLELATTYRGRLYPGRFSICTSYPLGLFKAWSWLEFDMATWVYPAPLEARTPAAIPAAPDSGNGAPAGEGMEDFAGLREYRSHDSLRHVDWKALARTDEMLIKQFAGEAASMVWLDFDALPPLGAEQRLSKLCQQMLRLTRRRQRFGLRLGNRTIGPAAGENHLHRCLEALAQYSPPAPESTIEYNPSKDAAVSR